MKYNHVVKRNGVWYPAGAEVPGFDAKPIPAIEPVEEKEEPVKPTRTEIQQMRKAQLLAMAEEVGIETDEETTASWLKTELLKHFGL